MALKHGQLYENDRFDRVDMEKHARNLMDHLSHIYGGFDNNILTMVEPSKVFLSINQAIPCALVLNELISNALKHAFEKTGRGSVRVSINNSSDDIVHIEVKDDGDGFPDGFDFNNPNGLGLKLVRHLVDGQLKGEMTFMNEDTTNIHLKFHKL